jgi:hypothetical protein
VDAQLLEPGIEQRVGTGDTHIGGKGEFNPAPTAAPLTAAIVGSAQFATARKPS